MNDRDGPHQKWGKTTRWLLWGGFAALWTVALLTTFPIRARDAILPQDYAFPTGKVLHVAAYAVFALLTAWLDIPRPWRWALLAVLSLHAFATEFLQQFVERTSSLTDVALDHLGIILAVTLSWRRWLGVTRSPPPP